MQKFGILKAGLFILPTPVMAAELRVRQTHIAKLREMQLRSVISFHALVALRHIVRGLLMGSENLNTRHPGLCRTRFTTGILHE